MGEQVADNTEMQLTTTLKENNGKLYAVTEGRAQRGLIKNEYLPIGQSLVYPKKWGKKEGSLKLVRHFIEEQNKIIENAKERIDKLQVLETELEKLNID